MFFVVLPLFEVARNTPYHNSTVVSPTNDVALL